jgi:hypothetical protein
MQTGDPGPRPLLIGDEIQQVWLDPHGVQLRMERAIISIQVDVEVAAEGRLTVIDPTEHTGDVGLLWGRLYIPITEARVLWRRVEFIFADEGRLTTVFDDQPYENGVITYSERGTFEVF